MTSGELLPRTLRPSTVYWANEVWKALPAWASVPLASTYFRFAGTAPTVNPCDFSQADTLSTLDWLGENLARNCAGVRNLWKLALPLVETAVA